MKSSTVIVLDPTLANTICSGTVPGFVHLATNNTNNRNNPKWEIHFMAEY